MQRFERRSQKTKKVQANDNNDNDDERHRVIASHTHSLIVSKNPKQNKKAEIINLITNIIWEK